ncbi:MAG TPA: hypothetical protein PLP25_11535 [Candidatus Limiplasma sp.]|nr:hypothetical protein [Candidatus Limiplasma sp.]HPS82478.1 hypothetical protein [Candidatus Limiplasma sp.]
MDHFMEEIVIRRNRALQEMLYYLASITMVIFALIGFWMLTNIFNAFSVLGLVILVFFGGSAVLMYLYKDRLRTEFEYTFTNGDLDFAQVFNNQKRKNLGTMRVKNVEAFGLVDSENFRKLINMPGMKRKNWFLNRDANLYYFYYQKESNRTMIVLEPSADLVEMIRKYLPHGVYHG